jgi:hypothetical protein
MLVRMWGKNTFTVLMGREVSVTTRESSMVALQKPKNITTIQSNNTTVGLTYLVPGYNRVKCTLILIAALVIILKLWKQPDAPKLKNRLRDCVICTQWNIF